MLIILIYFTLFNMANVFIYSILWFLKLKLTSRADSHNPVRCSMNKYLNDENLMNGGGREEV